MAEPLWTFWKYAISNDNQNYYKNSNKLNIMCEHVNGWFDNIPTKFGRMKVFICIDCKSILDDIKSKII